MDFAEALRKAQINEPMIEQILGVDYPRDGNPRQDKANFFAAAMRKCEQVLDFETISTVMFHRACCKSGFRLENAKKLAKEHGGESLEEKLELLGQLQYMGKPALNEEGDIQTVGIGKMEHCPCWNLGGCTPVNGPMPLAYCLCCAGHFLFHYKKALRLKLRVKKVVSSNLNSEGSEPCVFVYEVVK